MPDPVHVATVTGDALLSVPATKPAPLPGHVMLDAAMTMTPDRRSSDACTLSTTCAPAVARDLAVISKGPPVAGICATRSGSASGNAMVAEERVRLATVPTFADSVAVEVWAAARVGYAAAAQLRRMTTL
jgi:hypothetical protein